VGTPLFVPGGQARDGGPRPVPPSEGDPIPRFTRQAGGSHAQRGQL